MTIATIGHEKRNQPSDAFDIGAINYRTTITRTIN